METFGWYRLTGLLHKKYLGRGRVEVLPVTPGGLFFPTHTIFVLPVRPSFSALTRGPIPAYYNALNFTFNWLFAVIGLPAAIYLLLI